MNSFMKCERWSIHGRVHRVGYRYFCMRAARRHNIGGAARNCADDTVDVIAYGSVEALTAFFQELSKGPTLAHVTHIDREPVDIDLVDLDSFDTTF